MVETNNELLRPNLPDTLCVRLAGRSDLLAHLACLAMRGLLRRADGLPLPD